ncbi:MAG TPA: ABC transporter substrate-binding protein [Croceibacterium sp.]|nr:ABC transporter substrate-binding protein [Croceibacterium sp.]
MAWARQILILPFFAALLGCGLADDGALDVAFIDTPEDLYRTGVRLSDGAQHVRGATGAGLVTLDANGDVIPSLADRWIVTDDGRSFIFRLRGGKWPDGRDLTAESARAALLRAIRALRGTSLGLDLEPIDEVRAMAGRVVEIRLSSPLPMLLQLLAQPELALAPGGGDMAMEHPPAHCGAGGDARAEEGECASLAVLTMKPPQDRGIPEAEDWREYTREVVLRASGSQHAVRMFDDGEVDLVLGGGIGALPLVDVGPLSRGTVQIDPAIGLFGLHVGRKSALLETARIREALAMAIDRPALIGPFNISGWAPTTRIVAPGLSGESGSIPERWANRPVEELRAEASSRIAAWRQENGGAEAVLTLAIDRSPGLDMLFRELAGQFGTIGIRLVRADSARTADLVLVDRVARYADPRWFLNQFNCTLGNDACTPQADRLVKEALTETEPEARAAKLAEAEIALTLDNVYIPFGSPLRFSLVRGTVQGFAPNQWAFHPLPPLATIPR